MAKSKKTAEEYILLGTHHNADGTVLRAGDSIKLTPVQAQAMANKIRSSKEVVVVDLSNDELNQRIASLTTQLKERDDEVADLTTQLQAALDAKL